MLSIVLDGSASGDGLLHRGEEDQGEGVPPPAAVRRREGPLERAQRFQSMVEELGSRAAVARRLGCSRAWVTKAMRPLAGSPSPSPQARGRGSEPRTRRGG